jgi:hypothetical protein
MAILSDTLELALIKHLFKKAELTIPAGIWLGLHTSDPTDANAGSTEISGNGYARVQVVDNDHHVNSSSSSGMFSKFVFDTNDNLTNSSAIDFTEATGSWGTVSHWSLWTDATNTGSSYFLMSGALNSGVGVASGDQFRIASGQFDITFPNRWGVGSGTVSLSQSTAYNLYESTTEWRRQLARRLGFINEPWGPFHASGYDWANTYDPGSSSNRIISANRNRAWPNISLPYFGATFQSVNQTTGSVATSYVSDTHLYLGLYRSDPGSNVGSVAASSSGSTGEFDGNGYARQVVISPTFNVLGTPTTDGSGVTSISNTAAITFPEATGNWAGSVTHWGIYRGTAGTTSTYGSATQYNSNASATYNKSKDPILTGALTTPRSVNSGDILRFGIGDFILKLD